MMTLINYVPKIGEDVFTVTINGLEHDVVIMQDFGDGFVLVESLMGEPFTHGSMWGAYSSCQAVLPRRLLSYSYTQKVCASDWLEPVDGHIYPLEE